MHRQLLSVALAVVGTMSPAAAQADTVSDVAPFIVDVDATILDIEATIVDVDAGTATTETTEETTITLDADVFFDFDKDELRPDARDTLADVAAQIREDGATELHIGGHTDSKGDDDYNQRLSERRATAVESFLAGHLNGVQMTTEGFGERRPVASNETADGEDNPDGRALNRRVEITYPQG
jgi:outer membrane protein OmpA-like peptidoglycan-associated protein